MPSQIIVIGGSFLEGSNLVVVARIASAAEVVLFASDFSSWVYNVYDNNAGETANTPVATGGSGVPADILFTTLQLDGYWDSIDTIGYSMRHTVPASGFTPAHVGGHTYRLEYLLTSSAHGIVPIGVDAQCMPMRST